VAVFGNDFFAIGDRELVLAESNLLIILADQVHLDAARLFIVRGMVPVMLEVEIGIEFPVEVPQHIQVELSRHTMAVVISRLDDLWVLLQVRTNQQGAAWPRLLAHHA